MRRALVTYLALCALVVSTFALTPGQRAVLLSHRAMTAAQNKVYITTTGNDSNPCTLLLPCQTVTAAKTLVRTLAPTMTADINVYLRGGTYSIASTLAFGASDSGTGGHKVIWQSYPGESAIIDGGTVVTGFSLSSGSIYVAHVGTSVDFRQLYVNETRAIRARGAANPAGWTFTSGGLTAPDGTVAGYGNLTNVEIVSVGTYAMARCLIASAVTTTITMTTPCWSNVFPLHGAGVFNNVSWVENAFELMASGSWYLDRTAGNLYYWPPSGSMSGLTVVAPAVDNLLTFTSALNITFQNVTLLHSNWTAPDSAVGYAGNIGGFRFTNSAGTAIPPMDSAVQLSASTNITLTQMEFKNLGSGAILVNGGNNSVTITNNRFDAIAGPAMTVGSGQTTVAAGGTCPATTETGTVIENNYVPNGNAVDYTDGIGIYLSCSASATVQNNVIEGIPSQGILTGNGVGLISATGNTVTNNKIVANCTTYTDCGTVYFVGNSGTSFGTGNTATGNYSLGIGSNAHACLYTDFNSQWITETGNVCQTVSGAFILINAASATNISVTNNWSTTSLITNNGGANVTVAPNTTNIVQSGAVTAMNAAGIQTGVVPGVAGSYAGPGDVVPGAYAWWGLRAFSSNTRGNAAINVCLTGLSTCVDMLTDSVTGALIVTTVGGSSCSSVTCYVKTIYNQSPIGCGTACNLTNPTQARLPVLVVSCINGLPCMETVASNLPAITTSATVTGLSQAFTVSAVARHNANFASAAALFGCQGNVQVGFDGVGVIYEYASSVATVSGANDSHFNTIQGAFNSTQSEINLNGATTGALNPNTANCGALKLALFSTGTASYADADIVEAGIFYGVFSSNQLNSNQAGYWGPF